MLIEWRFGELGSDSVSLGLSARGGVLALDREGDVRGVIPSDTCWRRSSDFCFLSNLSASIAALLCSLSCKLPCLVEAPGGSEANQDIHYCTDLGRLRLPECSLTPTGAILTLELLNFGISHAAALLNISSPPQWDFLSQFHFLIC